MLSKYLHTEPNPRWKIFLLTVFIYGDSFAQSNYWSKAFAQSASETRILHNSKNFQVLLDNIGDSDVVIEECFQRVPTTLGRVYF